MDVFDEGDCSVEDLVMPRFLYNEDVSRGTWPHNPLDYGVLMASVFREQPCAQACNGVEFEHEVKKILEDPRQRYGSVNGRRGGGGGGINTNRRSKEQLTVSVTVAMATKSRITWRCKLLPRCECVCNI